MSINQLNGLIGAIKDMTKALLMAGQDPLMYLQRGICNYYLKTYQNAIFDFTKAIELDPLYAKVCQPQHAFTCFSIDIDVKLGILS
jgi:tetratricopeptide (TPR) repeat protein